MWRGVSIYIDKGTGPLDTRYVFAVHVCRAYRASGYPLAVRPDGIATRLGVQGFQDVFGPVSFYPLVELEE